MVPENGQMLLSVSGFCDAPVCRCLNGGTHAQGGHIAPNEAGAAAEERLKATVRHGAFSSGTLRHVARVRANWLTRGCGGRPRLHPSTVGGALAPSVILAPKGS